MKLSERFKKAFPREMTPKEVAEAERKQVFGDGKSLRVLRQLARREDTDAN